MAADAAQDQRLLQAAGHRTQSEQVRLLSPVSTKSLSLCSQLLHFSNHKLAPCSWLGGLGLYNLAEFEASEPKTDLFKWHRCKFDHSICADLGSGDEVHRRKCRCDGGRVASQELLRR
jgi:hypothetical protein